MPRGTPAAACCPAQGRPAAARLRQERVPARRPAARTRHGDRLERRRLLRLLGRLPAGGARRAPRLRPLHRVASDQGFAGQRMLEGGGERERGTVAVVRPRTQGARERLGQRRRVRRLDRVALDGRRLARQRRTPAREQLVRHAGQREHVGLAAERDPGGALGRGIRPAHGRAIPDPLERLDHPQSRQPHFVGRHQDVARVERTVMHARRRGEIEGARELADQPHGVRHGRGTVLLQRDVGRLGDEVLLHEIRGRAVRARGIRRDDRRVLEGERRQTAEVGGEVARLFRGEVEGERLDGDGPVLLGVVAAEHRAEHAGTYLVHDAEPAERGRRRRARRCVSWQRQPLLS